ncbi:MAG: DUF6159 family protein [Thermoplasmata archaeon]|nr:DUF6159 family protein [Thermoplasmata archaeon]
MPTFSDSWRLTKTSFRMIWEDKALLVLPALGGLVLLGVLALVALPFLVFGGFAWIGTALAPGNGGVLAALVAVGLVVYFALLFVGNFFTAALMGAAKLKLDGGNPTVADGLRMARAKVGRILLWSLVAGTVGLAIQAIARRLGPLGGFLFRILAGATWGIATYFVMPTILFENLGAWASLKRSASLFGQTFGKTIISNIVVALIGVGLFVLGFALLVSGILVAFSGSVVGGAVLAVLGVAVLIFTVVLMAAVSGVLRVALYRYATTGQIDPGLRPTNLPLPGSYRPT